MPKPAQEIVDLINRILTSSCSQQKVDTGTASSINLDEIIWAHGVSVHKSQMPELLPVIKGYFGSQSKETGENASGVIPADVIREIRHLSSEHNLYVKKTDDRIDYASIIYLESGSGVVALEIGTYFFPSESKKNILKKILIVDDCKNTRELLSDILDGRYSVSTASDGIKALEEVEREKPDLIILDVMMPGMDGYEVCRRLRSDARYKALPIIMASGRTGAEDIRKGMEAGANDYIGKPIPSLEFLFYKIDELLNASTSEFRDRVL